MYQVIWQEDNKIEIALSDELTADEFREVIHQLESLCTMYQDLHVLFDAANLKHYAFKILLDEFEFYKKYKSHLKRVALVSDRPFESFLLEQFNKFSDTEFKTFDNGEIEKARRWIFPSRLP